MKNKTKKILAGACLGLVGMGCLTGCAMSDEQKAAIDLMTEKYDEIVNLLEENMQLQNAQLSKTDAVELVTLAQTKLKLNIYDELYMKTTSTAYEGFFEKKLGSAQSNAPFVYYKKTDTMKYAALCDFDGSLKIIQKADFENDIAYMYNAEVDQKQETEFSSGMFDLSSQVDPLSSIGLKHITVDDIVNIETTEDGYKFNILATVYNFNNNGGTESHIVTTYMSTFEITKEANFKSGTFNVVNKNYTAEEVEKEGGQVVLDEEGLPVLNVYACNNILSVTYNVEYQYEGINFNFIDDKIAQIEAE